MQKIIFVTGKGGVGKSTYAAVLAQKYAKSGKKTLLVELGDQSYYQEFFSLPQGKVNYNPSPLESNLDLALWSGEECLKEYALYLLKSPMLYKLFFENKVSKTLIQIAPALQELAILGKITAGPRQHGPPVKHEVIVVDSYATGHFLSLMKAPQGMAETIQFGPMGEQSRSILATLKREDLCEYHIVTLAEELPMVETAELKLKIEVLLGVTCHLVFNKIVLTELSSSELKLAATSEVKALVQSSHFVSFFKNILQQQEKFIGEIKAKGQSFQILPLEINKEVGAFLQALGEKG